MQKSTKAGVHRFLKNNRGHGVQLVLFENIYSGRNIPPTIGVFKLELEWRTTVYKMWKAIRSCFLLQNLDAYLLHRIIHLSLKSIFLEIREQGAQFHNHSLIIHLLHLSFLIRFIIYTRRNKSYYQTLPTIGLNKETILGQCSRSKGKGWVLAIFSKQIH